MPPMLPRRHRHNTVTWILLDCRRRRRSRAAPANFDPSLLPGEHFARSRLESGKAVTAADQDEQEREAKKIISASEAATVRETPLSAASLSQELP
ncbi:hypothetical protein GUJ93_ZPchr0006g41307 [Zizania palustris]|uniref:Uncharacterized protein n=1 Tax=Zizania palustris TaxID=103762 RepID=A0A8J5SGU7_ZIZPA|nr:hypothetical protein GUJ93_ZPchr0006g41307 [Zizania palustris]